MSKNSSRKLNHVVRDKGASPAQVQKQEEENSLEYSELNYMPPYCKTSCGIRFRVWVKPFGAQVEVNEEDVINAMADFGSCDPDFAISFVTQLANLSVKGKKFDIATIRFSISFVRGLRPRDQISAWLGFHMVAAHLSGLINLNRINQAQFAEFNQQEENADRAVSRIARTSMALVDAFDRHQSGGEQKVTIRHMTAKEGRINTGSDPIELAKPSKRPKRKSTNPTLLTNGHDVSANEMVLGEKEDGQ